jgi:ComF family protein
VTVVDYSHPWDRLITHFKFHDGLDLAQVFARQLCSAIERAQPVPPVDLVVPIPLSDARLRERGYNQAWEIARRVARARGTKADARLLLRIHDRPHQLALAPAARSDNVKGVFAVEPMRQKELVGRSLALVDDVMTTMATAAEASRVLLEAGAAQVQVWTVARTPRPDTA